MYNLAADMGGMGFIENNKALCMLSVLINTHLLMAARELGARRYFYASSACVYNADKQRSADVTPVSCESRASVAHEERGMTARIVSTARRDIGGGSCPITAD